MEEDGKTPYPPSVEHLRALCKQWGTHGFFDHQQEAMMHRELDAYERIRHYLNPLCVYARLIPSLGVRWAWKLAWTYEKAYNFVSNRHLSSFS
jgi:hypothetical protein